jgi:hypothetical protein
MKSVVYSSAQSAGLNQDVNTATMSGRSLLINNIPRVAKLMNGTFANYEYVGHDPKIRRSYELYP